MKCQALFKDLLFDNFICPLNFSWTEIGSKNIERGDLQKSLSSLAQTLHGLPKIENEQAAKI